MNWVKYEKNTKLCIEVSGDDFGEDVSTTMQRHHSATPKMPHLEMELGVKGRRIVGPQVLCHLE